MQLKVGQVYTFDNKITYHIINNIEDDELWYQIWQVGDKKYYNPNLYTNIIWQDLTIEDIIFVGVDFISKAEFSELFKKEGKFLGIMNEDFGLDKDWKLVPKRESKKLWIAMEEM